MSGAAARAAQAKGWPEYASFGRVFRVERAGRGRLYWAVGRARGARAMFLDKLGPRPTREAMQSALDAWAERRGLRAATENTEGGGHGQG